MISGGAWTLIETEDLRGKVPNTTAGGGAGGTGVTDFTGLLDTPSSYVGEALKIHRVNAAEDAVEFVDPLFQDLTDKDTVYQASNTYVATGAAVFDMSKNIIDIALTGNVTGVTFSNEPAAAARGSWLLNVVQDVTGGWTIDWSGSGVFVADGEVSADMQPNATASTLTQYWMYWTGFEWIMRIVKVATTAL